MTHVRGTRLPTVTPRSRRIAAAIALLVAGVVPAAAVAGPFRAGAAVVDVSPRNAAPEPPSIVAGGFLEARADRVHDPLYVRAIVLDDGGGPPVNPPRAPVRIALVVVDTCMMPQPLVDEAKRLAAGRSGIPVERMLVSATHTHAAPAAMGCLGTREDAPYAKRLPAAIAEAIVAANEKLEPAAVGVGAIDDWEHTHNRRWIRRPETRVVDPFGSPTGLANMHPGHLSKDVIGPSGPVDPQLSLVSLRTAAGRPLALFACYSQHYFGAAAVSADYFGHFCRAVAGGLGLPGAGNGPFVCGLAQGTSGDLMWMDYGSAKRPIAIHDYAAAGAKKALTALETIEHRDDVTLAMAERTLPLDYRVPDEARLAWARAAAATIKDDVPKSIREVYAREALILHDRRRTSLKLQAIRIGDATIAALPNETYALTGLRLRSRSPARLHFTVALANGAEGYIPPPEQHVLGGYTTWPARTAGLEVGAEPKIVATLVAALEEVTNQKAAPQEVAHGPYARGVLGKRPLGFWRCEEDEGESLGNSVPGAPAAPLAPGFAWHLPGVGAGTGIGAGQALRPGPFSGPGRINRAVHLAGGEIALPVNPAADATLLVWAWLGERSGASARSGAVCTGLAAAPLVAAQDAAHAVRFELGGVRGSRTFPADEWHALAFVRRGDRVALHVDGAAEPELTGPAGTGREPLVVGRGLQGKVDEIAVFDRPLAADEIADLWRSSGVAEQLATEAAARKAADEERVRQAAAPVFPEDHDARITKLGPARYWRLDRPPENGLPAGGVRFAPGAFGLFEGGRITARDDVLDGEWSAAFWFRSDPEVTARPVTAYLFSRGPQGDREAPGDHLGIGGAATPTASGRLIVFNGNAANGLLPGRTPLPPRSWNHAVLVRRGSRVTVWLNGASAPEIDGDLPTTAADAREFFVGARSDGFAPLDGHMATVAVFDRALSAAEAAEVFAASGRKPGEAPAPVPPPAAEKAAGPRSPEETRRGIRVPAGYRVELVAAEPDVLDPVAFDWDPTGRLWVVEMADYPSGMDGAGKPGGRVRVLEDVDGDGRYEKSRLFADGLSFPNGIVTWRDGVIVTAAPQILLLRDTDGDGAADLRETLLDGFLEGNQQLRVNGLRRGLDNTLWCASGGHHGGHGSRTEIVSTKTGRRHAIGSHDFRFDPDTGAVWIESGPSQFGRCRDPHGHWFGTQNANPLWHWVIADRYVARNPFVAPERTIHHVVGANSPPVRPASPPEKRYHSFEQAGRYTSACGSTVDGAGGLFPGGGLHAFTCEPFHNLVQHNVLTAAGASFTASWPAEEGPTDFFAADDGWCRPVMARIGPDGALWVADMYRAVIEHPDWLPPGPRAELQPRYRLGDDRGRIWRVVRDGAPAAGFPAAVRRAASVADRVALLAGDGTWQRDLAQSLIVREEDAARRREAVGPLASLATANPRPETRLHALWALEGLESLDDGLLVAALGDADPRVREQAVLLAERRSTPAVVAAAAELAADADPQVVLQVALSCGEWREPAAAEALLAIAARHADDPLVRSAVGTSALAHFPAFGAGVARGDARLRDAYQGQVVRMTAGRRDREALAGLIAAAVDRGPADGPTAIESLLDAMQPLGFDPWTLAEKGDGPEPPLAAALGRLDHALSELEGIATDDARADDARFTAARVLSKASRTRGRGLELLSGRLGPRVDPAVQLAALDAIGKSGAAEAPSVLAAAWPGLGPVARGRAIDVWLSRPAWTIDLLDRIAARDILAGSLALQQRDRLLSHPDKAIARRAAGELAGGATSARQDVVARYAGALAGAGDAGRGREVYRRACAACHRRAEDGREVGPDLATVVGHAPERLLANILDPNADIQPGYHASTCGLGSGEVVSGIVTAESGGSLTMKLADGSTRTIARAEIDEFVTANRSLMPEGLETTVTVEEMRDLLVFLRTR